MDDGGGWEGMGGSRGGRGEGNVRLSREGEKEEGDSVENGGT